MIKNYYLLTTIILLILCSCKSHEKKDINKNNKEIPITTNTQASLDEVPVVSEESVSSKPLPVPDVPRFSPPAPTAIPIFVDHSIGNSDDDNEGDCCNGCHLGTRSFSAASPDEWFDLETLAYPEVVLLSINGNQGSTQGGIALTPTGLQVNASGSYWANFNVVLLNNTEIPHVSLIPIFLIPNGIFDPFNTPPLLGDVGALPLDRTVTIQSSGTLQNLEAGTTLSLVATNGGCPQPEGITVLAWSISLYKICN